MNSRWKVLVHSVLHDPESCDRETVLQGQKTGPCPLHRQDNLVELPHEEALETRKLRIFNGGLLSVYCSW